MSEDLAETRDAFEAAYEGNRKTVRLPTMQVYEGDKVMLDQIVEFLGCSQSEAVRSAIRIMATQLPLKGKPRRRTLQYPS